MTPVVPKFATMNSLLSVWARCQRIDLRAKVLRGNQATVLSHDLSLGYKLGNVMRSEIGEFYTPDRLIDRHTQVPLYTSVMHPPQALRWREHLTSGAQVRDTTAQGIRNLGLVESKTLRRCPSCVADDIARYGCAHWRLFHQWPFVRHCVVHGDLLHSSCAGCHMPFVLGDQARLADDNCPNCCGSLGSADPFVPPVGYWPLVRLMYGALIGNGPDLALIHRNIAGLDIQPRRIGYGSAMSRAQILALRACHAWDVQHLHELAALLGVNWIWSNETERSASHRELPTVVKLALIASSDAYRNDIKAMNDEPFSLLKAA